MYIMPLVFVDNFVNIKCDIIIILNLVSIVMIFKQRMTVYGVDSYIIAAPIQCPI